MTFESKPNSRAVGQSEFAIRSHLENLSDVLIGFELRIARLTRTLQKGLRFVGGCSIDWRKASQGPIVAIVSGGNVDLKKFCEIIGS